MSHGVLPAPCVRHSIGKPAPCMSCLQLVLCVVCHADCQSLLKPVYSSQTTGPSSPPAVACRRTLFLFLADCVQAVFPCICLCLLDCERRIWHFAVQRWWLSMVGYADHFHRAVCACPLRIQFEGSLLCLLLCFHLPLACPRAFAWVFC